MAFPKNQQTDDWIEKGFQLAFFLLRDRRAAIETVKTALNQLEIQKMRERKRTYWRNKNLKEWIYKASKTDSDLLQWLIYSESSDEEKRQETAAPSIEILIIRYIKCLVQITTALSSFHLNIGLQRLLRSYSTPETQKLYELVTDRHIGADEYRRAKGLLIAKLQARFGSLIKLIRGSRDEERFEAMENQSQWTELVDECLKAFAPWSNRKVCLVPPNFDPRQQSLPWQLTGTRAGKQGHDVVEANRFHAFLHPVCFERLTSALGLGSPQEKLRVPKFFTESGDGPVPGLERHPPASPLTEQERGEIRQHITDQASRRRRTSSSMIIVRVDGIERLKMDTSEDCEQRFEIEEGVELIQVWGQDDKGELVLASHRVGHDQRHGFALLDAPFLVYQKKKLGLHISPHSGGSLGLRRATVTVTCGQQSWYMRFWEPKPWLFMLPKYALIALLSASLGWLLATRYDDRKQKAERSAMERIEKQLAEERKLRLLLQSQTASASGATIFYKLLPDNFANRDPKNAGIVRVVVPASPAVINLQLFSRDYRHERYRVTVRTFLGEHEILAETLVRSRGGTAEQPLVVPIASTLLAPGQLYTVELEYALSNGSLQEGNTFTFEAVKDRRSAP